MVQLLFGKARLIPLVWESPRTFLEGESPLEPEKTIRDAAAGESLYIACTRGGERVLAVAGAVNGALTEFEATFGVANGGVVCALPSLLYNVFFESLERFILKKRSLGSQGE